MKKQVSLKLYIGTVSALIAVILIMIVSGILFMKSDGGDVKSYEAMSMQYDDYMQGFKVKTIDGEVLEGLPDTDGYRVVFYLSSTCHGCAEILDNYDRLKSVFGEEDINYIFLWVDKISEKLIEQNNIDREICYEMVDYKLSTTTPTFYVLDNNAKVKFFTTDSLLLVEKLVDMKIVSEDELKDNANEYILKNFFGDSDKKKMIYFAMQGCKDCEAADPIVESKEVEEIYDVVKIYKYDDVDNSHVRDKDAIFKHVYGIKWYPSFLIFGEDSKTTVIGETPISELKSLLVNQ